jgi:DNA replication protein DnaC
MSQEDAKRVNDWIKSGKNMLIYLGNPGSGKTYLCAALIKYCWPRFESVRFWRESHFMARLGKSMNEGMSARAEVPFMIDDEFLIYDDLGSAGEDKTGSTFKSDIIFDIIDTRYNSMKPTVITTNLTVEEMKDRYAPRTLSRLFARENCLIEIRDVDRRRLFN